MKEIELLAPAGSYEAFIAAIQNGADAVYLSGTLFGARSFANNFDQEQLKEAVQYAHLYGVSVYVTVNTLIYDHELEEIYQYIDYLYAIQVDAVIVQDFGLLQYITTCYPDFEIHASTQMSIHSLSGVSYLEKHNIKRVVIARENTIDEIKYITDHSHIDIEAFVHGALCVCYSGQCLMSSSIGGRSGNRGKCAQPCRLSYSLLLDGKPLKQSEHYLLSPKDLNTLDYVHELMEANIKSFKIEGRMKRPEYVASVVSSYKQAIQSYPQPYSLTKKHDELTSLFNRDFTKGYIMKDASIMNPSYPSNTGVLVGKVNYYNQKIKKIGIELTETLYQGDGIRFGYEDEGLVVNKIYLKQQLVNHGDKKDIIELDYTKEIKKDTLVYKTSNSQLLKSLQKTYDRIYRKIPIELSLFIEENKPVTLILSDQQGHQISISSTALPEKAQTTPLSKERATQQILKFGNTIYDCTSYHIQISDNISFPIKELNQLRRDAIAKLDEMRANKAIHTQTKKQYNVSKLNKKVPDKPKIAVSVQNLSQLQVALEEKVDVIYYPYQKDLKDAIILAQQYHKKITVMFPRINKDEDIIKIKNDPVLKDISLYVIHDYGLLNEFDKQDIVIGSSLNVINHLTASFYQNHRIQVSYELNRKAINQLYDYAKEIEVMVYGRVENMVSEYCPISHHHFKEKRVGCNLCKLGTYHLKDRMNEDFPILMDESCRMHLYHHKPIIIDDIQGLKTDYISLHFTIETQEEVKEIIQYFKKVALNKVYKGLKEKYPSSSGFFKKEITKNI